MNLPLGFEWVTPTPRAAFMRPEAAHWARSALAEYPTLWTAARERGPEFTLQGRAPLMVVPAGGDGEAGGGSEAGSTLWVIRRYLRGGGMSFLGDRHLRVGVLRPLGEAASSETLRSSGIETPRVIGGAIYSSGVVYRAELVTEYLPGMIELKALLLSPDEPWHSDMELRLGAVAKVGALVARLARAGARHPDLNAANLLISSDGSQTTAVVVDLDRCQVAEGEVAVQPMLRRLKRSVDKSAAAMGAPFPTDAWEVLTRAAFEGSTD